MTQQYILNEVTNSSWQPQFEFTTDLDAVVRAINSSCEDDFLGFDEKIKEIILDTIAFAEKVNKNSKKISYYKPFAVTFEDLCNWQKELFEYKQELIDVLTSWSPSKDYSDAFLAEETSNLPNQHIDLGLRDNSLEDLKEMCFPILLNQTYDNHKGYYFMSDFSLGKENDLIKHSLTKWYKIFQTIRFFEDFNGRLGGIVVNILSYLLTGKYLIKL